VIKGNSKIAEYYPPPAHQWLIDHGHKVTVTEVTGWWKDTGKPEALLEGNSLVLHSIETDSKIDIPDDAIVEGKVQIDEGTKIGDGVKIRGPVVIGKNCKLNHCYIGPYTSIGDEVIVEQAEIEHSIVMNNVEIYTDKRIVDSILGVNCKVTSVKDTKPAGHQLVIGDNTLVQL